MLAELELAKVNVEVAAPLEQLPRDCEALTSITGQSAVEVVVCWDVSPVKLFDVSDDVNLQVIDKP